MAPLADLMRLAIVTTNRNYPWGGAEHLWHALALAARARDWPVLAVAGPLTLDSEPINQLRSAGVEIVALPPEKSVGGGRLAPLRKFHRRFAGSRETVGAALRRFSPDMLLVNQCGAFDGAWEYWLQGVIAATKVPYATVTHNNDGTTPGPTDLSDCIDWVTGASLVGFVSEELRDLAALQLGQSIPKALVVQNPIRQPDESSVWPSASLLKMAVVGRLEIHEKGLDMLIAAIAKALGHESGWQLDFFGRGPDETAILEAAQRAGIRDKVTLQGYRGNPFDIWRDHHLCVLASRWEGFSLVMAEAMVSGHPVLRTRSGGAGWIEPGKTGWLCEPGDVDSLADSLRTAWAQRSSWQAMGAEARRTLLDRIDPLPAETLLDHLAALQPASPS